MAGGEALSGTRLRAMATTARPGCRWVSEACRHAALQAGRRVFSSAVGPTEAWLACGDFAGLEDGVVLIEAVVEPGRKLTRLSELS